MAKATQPTTKTSSQAKGAASAKTAKTAKVKGNGAAELPVLRPVPLYEFTAGGFSGYVRLSDPNRGIEFSAPVDGKSLPAFSQEVLSLRHYFARGDGGFLAPREEAECQGKVGKHGVSFSHAGSKAWPVEAAVQYDLLPQGGVDAAYTFTFAKPVKGFEAGVETLMPKSQPVVYVHSGGVWTRMAAGPQAQRFYLRNAAAAEMMADGRWDGLRLAGVILLIETHGYDYPMVVVRDEKTGWALAHMALTEECTCVWLNGAHRTVGFGLIGADARARDTITCRARVVLCQADRLDDTLAHYRDFVQEARAHK